MKLTYEQICAVVLGAERIEQEERGVRFHRMTAEQEAIYAARKKIFADQALHTSGIRLRFYTDSPELGLKIWVDEQTSREYFSMEVLADGERIGFLNNDVPGKELNYDDRYPLGEFSGRFALPAGQKEIRIEFPFSDDAVLTELMLADGASLIPIRPEKSILFFGDSITHGYDALWPSKKYSTLLADALGYEEVNKAIAGDRFTPELAALKGRFAPAMIIVAYGTNDWGGYPMTAEEIQKNAAAFFENLCRTYPGVPVYALTPLWRKDRDQERKAGSFDLLPGLLETAAAPHPQITVINCYNAIPHDEAYFFDRKLHPNDAGYAHYFEYLLSKIK